MMSWDWKPGVFVGELVFGAALRPGDFDCPIEPLPGSSDDASWQTYRIGDELGRVSIEDGKIASVECVISLRLDGKELLGLGIDEVNHLLPEAAIL
jgi:hypothetical protein